jgi:hypothetical protein
MMVREQAGRRCGLAVDVIGLIIAVVPASAHNNAIAPRSWTRSP